MMSNDMYSDGPTTDNNDSVTPPPVLPPEEEAAYDGPRHNSPRFDGPQYETAARERHRPPSYVRWIGGCLIVFVVLLVLCGGGTAVLAALTLGRTPATATFDKTFSVGGVPTLVIHGQLGSVHVNAGSAGQVLLHATKRVRVLTHAQAQSELDAITITTNQTGNVVTIEVNNTFAGGPRLFNTQEIDLNVTTPANTNLNVVERAGSLDATGLTGTLMAEVNAGSVTLDNMTMADGSLLRVNAGSLSVDGALQSHASLTVNVNAGSLDLTLPKNTSAHLDASASAGSVHVNGWDIAQTHEGANVTASGDLNPNPTGAITIHVSAGSATLNAA